MPPDEFATTPLPPHLIIHTWPDCTLTELTHHVAAASSPSSLPLLPDPAIGTRLTYRLIFVDTRSAPAGGAGTRGSGSAAPRYTVKELGSVVIGDGGPALDPNAVGEADKTTLDDPSSGDGGNNHSNNNSSGSGSGGGDGNKTLADARFVPGDYISCAILPPLPDGSVAPASDARTGRGAGLGEARALVGRPPDGGARAAAERENGFPRAAGRRPSVPGSDRGRYHRFSGHRGAGAGSGGGGGVPIGEWRRDKSYSHATSGGCDGINKGAIANV
ncbi:hypothetical protein DL762_010404 [Monosporascus cannonballus]|uniref:Uncharacterized protein n=1 Tax=Monosporascus cannonballus TaxID=155416 RepID=A0ABY0GV16_9PEZI|nr:hypothetical protein DL762_010404 [Monosporascus cannonballus]